jgi:hypothetical protein
MASGVFNSAATLLGGNFVNQVSASELSGTGYVGGFGGAGRKALASKTITEDDTNDRGTYDAADPSAWTGLNAGTIGGVIVIKENTTDADSDLLAFIDTNDLVTNGSDVTFNIATAGLFYLSTV